MPAVAEAAVRMDLNRHGSGGQGRGACHGGGRRQRMALPERGLPQRGSASRQRHRCELSRQAQGELRQDRWWTDEDRRGQGMTLADSGGPERRQIVDEAGCRQHLLLGEDASPDGRIPGRQRQRLHDARLAERRSRQGRRAGCDGKSRLGHAFGPARRCRGRGYQRTA